MDSYDVASPEVSRRRGEFFSQLAGTKPLPPRELLGLDDLGDAAAASR